MACYAVKPPSLKNFDLTDIQCRDFWISYSESTMADFLISQFDNARIAIKDNGIDYKGKRMFIAVCTGQISKYIKWKHLEGTRCNVCHGIYSTARILYDEYECVNCKVSIRGTAPKKNKRLTEDNRIFIEYSKKYLI